jgi:predicted regulator of Ras-like GTPase activity (Roadblock/LC7/MglB family)
MRFIAAHSGIILAHLKELHNSGRVGLIDDVVIATTDCRLLIGCIDDDYSLVMNIVRSCPTGLALYHFRDAVKKLKKEI